MRTRARPAALSRDSPSLTRMPLQVPDGDIPCQFEKFYSGHILPNRHPATQVDVKKSGYKKLAKLFSTWEKKGVLTTKVVHKQDTIVAVNKGHKARAGDV